MNLKNCPILAYRTPQFAYALQIEVVFKISDLSVVLTLASDVDAGELIPSTQQTGGTSIVTPSSQNLI